MTFDLRPGPQPFAFNNGAALLREQLATQITDNTYDPVHCTASGLIFEGVTRFDILLELGVAIEDIRYVVHEDIADEDAYEASIRFNAARRHITPDIRAEAIREFYLSKDRQPTQQDIAKLFGCAQPTVSRALAVPDEPQTPIIQVNNSGSPAPSRLPSDEEIEQVARRLGGDEAVAAVKAARQATEDSPAPKKRGRPRLTPEQKAERAAAKQEQEQADMDALREQERAKVMQELDEQAREQIRERILSEESAQLREEVRDGVIQDIREEYQQAAAYEPEEPQEPAREPGFYQVTEDAQEFRMQGVLALAVGEELHPLEFDNEDEAVVRVGGVKYTVARQQIKPARRRSTEVRA